MNEALVALGERHNVTTPLSEMVSEITERVYRELEVVQAFDDSISRPELHERVGLSSNEVDEAIRSLESKGVVKIEDDQILKQAANL